MYLYDKNRITYFAETDRRNKRLPFGIKAEDRTRHMYIIGKTGMGKSTLIENMVAQDIKNGEGFAFIDPHGKSAAMLLDYIPPDRVKDVVYFAPFDTDNPISFNVMEDVGPDKRHLVANGLLSAFKKIWGPETFSARMEYIMMNALLALLEYPESTLLGVSRMLTDKAYRKKIVDNVKDPSVKAYWVDEFAKYSENYAKDAVPGIQNKLGQFTSNPLIRNIIGQSHSSFDLRKMMDERKILIVNLSKGQLGEGNANLLGGMIITKIYLAAMSRADLVEDDLKKLPNFYMYVDEFQSFANESFADILSEARKYKLALVVAHQYIKQMDEKVADAVFGNVGTQIMFRVGAPDAEVLEKEYAPVFTAEDMVSLGFTQIYLKLMIDGVASHPFSAVTLAPIAPPSKSLREEVIISSRTLYGHPRAVIEKNITDWYATVNEVAVSTERPKPNTSPTPAPRADYPPKSQYQTPPAQRSANQTSTNQATSQTIKPTSIATSHPPARDGNTMFAPPRQNTISQNTVGRDVRMDAPKQAEKFEKPFAQAFKDIQKPTQSREIKTEIKPAQEVANLSTLNKANRTNGAFPTVKSKGPTPESMSELKQALAGVLKEEKKTPPPEVPKPEETIREKPRTEPQSIPQNLGGQIKEVPEDVLTAILRGEE